MVTRSRKFRLALILLVLYIPLALIPITPVHAAVTYVVNKEWVHIWINKDGSIDIQYNITLTYTSGSPQGIVTVGMPKGGFRIESVRDISGNTLSYKDISGGGFYGIEVQLKTPIVLNQRNTFIIYAVIPDMVKPDQTNPGNVGMQFYPSTFDGASEPIGNIRVRIDFPESISETNMVFYLEGREFQGVIKDGDKIAGVYWEKSDWPAAEEFWVGVSFPAKYVSLGPDIWYYVTIGGSVAAVFALGAVVLMRLKKANYEKPRIAIEALGAARGLTAVEAAVVLESKPVRVLTMILFGLLLKRMVMVTATDPVIRLQRLERPADTPTPPLRYYEIDYLRALEPDGSLNEMALARTYLYLRDAVDRKLRGYSRADTINYYRSVVNKAWEQVTRAGTPELKGDAIDQNIEWLLTDDRFDEKLRGVFPPDLIIYPRPGWWWYWGGPHFPPAQRPAPPTIPTEAKPIPAQEFANNIVRGLETASNNIVKNVQDFTNRLIPAQTAAVREHPVRRGSSCVCACAHCACACACVSCACACAHGGAR
ncbi:MAG: hypothetical protein QXF26_08745 [Candidatus Bathyarchaeia archaeon]